MGLIVGFEVGTELEGDLAGALEVGDVDGVIVGCNCCCKVGDENVGDEDDGVLVGFGAVVGNSVWI